MKTNFRLILIFSIFAGFAQIGCSPVRSGSYQAKPKEIAKSQSSVSAKKEEKNSKIDSTSKKNTASSSKYLDDSAIIERKNKKPKEASSAQKARFADTVTTKIIIDMQKNVNQKEKALLNILRNLDDADNEALSEDACTELMKYQDFTNISDSVRTNAIFHKGECYLNKNEIDLALKCFEKVAGENIDASSIEKSLLRLGHIFCYKKDFDKAEMYFTELKNKFPESQYLKIANCESVNASASDKKSE